MTLEQIEQTAHFLKQQGIDKVDVGVVLGSGLNRFVEHITIQHKVPYTTIPHFPQATVEFHQGQLIYGTIGRKKVLVMQGRFHAYEGYTPQQITFPIRVMKVLGAETLLLSNAAGGINLSFKKGDLVIIHDHIHLQSGNPLTGKNLDALGGRFPDMSEPYDFLYIRQLKQIAAEQKVPVKEGVYVCVNGPNLETRAEYRFLKVIGADMVGMSTVPEVIVARHMNMKVAAVSVITDECDPEHLKPVDIEEIIAVASQADETLSRLFRIFIEQLP